MVYKSRLRARIVLASMSLVATALIVSLYKIQVRDGAKYANKADAQYARPSAALFDRGSIYFQTKDKTRVVAATISNGYLAYINPSILQSPSQVYDVLSSRISLDKTDFLKRAAKKDDRYEEIAHRLDELQAEDIKNLAITGVGVTKESWRSYPGGELAAHALGILGENASSTVAGRYGLERYYEDVLSRSSVGSGAGIFAQIFSGVGDYIFSEEASKKGDLVTSLEPSVQGYLQKILANTNKKWNADELGGIVMDPITGEIVAMASLPDFDLNNTAKVKDVHTFSNPLVEHAYELGSIMKPLTVAVGIDSGSISKNWIYEDTGTMTLNGKKISNYDGKARGSTSTQQILSQSLNIGAATIALKVGSAKMRYYFESLGFGKKTGIDLPSEASGLIGNLKSAKDIDLATASYGQGIAVSPVQMIAALSALANGGESVRPHLARRIDYEDGTSEDVEIDSGRNIFSKDTALEVTEMLVNVVDHSLKNGALKRERHSIAAKTGTAQIPDPKNGGYHTDRYLHSFFGYFPAYKPRFIVFLYHVYPKGAQYASETLTDPFDEMAGFLINYYNIPPDR